MSNLGPEGGPTDPAKRTTLKVIGAAIAGTTLGVVTYSIPGVRNALTQGWEQAGVNDGEAASPFAAWDIKFQKDHFDAFPLLDGQGKATGETIRINEISVWKTRDGEITPAPEVGGWADEGARQWQNVEDREGVFGLRRISDEEAAKALSDSQDGSPAPNNEKNEMTWQVRKGGQQDGWNYEMVLTGTDANGIEHTVTKPIHKFWEGSDYPQQIYAKDLY